VGRGYIYNRGKCDQKKERGEIREIGDYKGEIKMQNDKK
jgi:hypothetical protein